MTKKLSERERKEKEFFDSLAKADTEYWGCTTLTGRYRLSLRGKLIKNILGGNKKTILDLGCGFGDLTQHLVDLNAKIYAIDISPKSISAARKKIKSQKVNFIVGSAHSLDFKPNTFDAIVGNSILHHLDLEKTLPEILRTLKKGGKIIFFEPNFLNPQIFAERKIPYFRKLARNSPDETAFIRWSLKQKMKSYGFKNVSVKPYDFLYPALPLKLAKKLLKVSKFLERTPLIRELSGSLKITASKN